MLAFREAIFADIVGATFTMEEERFAAEVLLVADVAMRLLSVAFGAPRVSYEFVMIWAALAIPFLWPLI